MRHILFLLLGFMVVTATFSQSPSSEETNIHDPSHDHQGLHQDHDHAHQHNFEIGFGAGFVRLLNEKENAPGIHFHILKSLGKKQRFSIGPGFEYIADEHAHAAAVVSLGYRPIHPLLVGISPGFTFPLTSKSEHSEAQFSTHFEILYEFEFDFVHLGPMLEYSWSAEDQHIMIALHFGFSF